MTDLVIVESPTKAKEVAHILGPGYVVKASVGHIRDLPLKSMGVDLNDFSVSYVLTDRGRKTVSMLRQLAAAATTVFLATDLDREGEAIAWHLFDELKLKRSNTKRVVYNEITETAVKAAFQNARDINYEMVRAQEARRVLDRLVGYTVSPHLWGSGVAGLSAGRVQSVALRLVVERDREIGRHSKRKHFGAQLDVSGVDPAVTAEWNAKPFADEDGLVMRRDLAEDAASVSEVSVSSYKQGQKKKKPPAPFTTSSMQQKASAKLNLPSAQTMKLAQRLFDNGQITYMRTDSYNISQDGLGNIRSYAESRGYPVPDSPIPHQVKSANAQEAHECIRPTDMFFEGETLDPEHARLYRLIHEQTLACQLPYAELFEQVVEFTATQPVNDNVHTYGSRATQISSPGFMAVMGAIEESTIPVFQDGDVYNIDAGRVTEKETKPPSHFTEGTLTAALEKKGIGRPSTYAAILENIKRKKYIVPQGKKLLATELGDKLIEILRPESGGGCEFMEYQYTADLEARLDEIARGEAQYQPVVKEAYATVETDSANVGERVKGASLETAKVESFAGKKGKKSTRRGKAKVVVGDTSATVGAPVAIECSACGKPMKKRPGKNGDFLGCTGYPQCKNTQNIGGPNKSALPAQPSTNKKCSKCSSNMVLRNGSNGQFYGCSGYPKCKQTENVEEAK